MRVYLLPNWDGTKAVLVACQNQKEACRALRTGQQGFRDYGGQRIDNIADHGFDTAVALEHPGRVFARKIDSHRGDLNPWVMTGLTVPV